MQDFIPVSMTYKETDEEYGNGRSRPIVDERIGRFFERLKLVLGNESGRSFARRSGVNEGSLRNMLRGGMPQLDTLLAIADASGVNVVWLATGEGPMRKSDVVTKEGEHPHAVREPVAHYDAGEYATAPFYDVDASCGHGAWNDNAQIISQLAFRRDWLKSEGLESSMLAAIRARGDSMAPTIQSGDTLLVDLRVNTPRNDGIYIIEQDGGISAKRIQRAPDGSLYIRSDNKAYEDFHLPQGHDLKIIGRLAWFGRRVD